MKRAGGNAGVVQLFEVKGRRDILGRGLPRKLSSTARQQSRARERERERELVSRFSLELSHQPTIGAV